MKLNTLIIPPLRCNCCKCPFDFLGFIHTFKNHDILSLSPYKHLVNSTLFFFCLYYINFYIYLLRWIILFLSHIYLLRNHRLTDKETSEEPRCGYIERLSNSKQSAKYKNNHNQFDSCTSVSYGPFYPQVYSGLQRKVSTEEVRRIRCKTRIRPMIRD